MFPWDFVKDSRHLSAESFLCRIIFLSLGIATCAMAMALRMQTSQCSIDFSGTPHSLLQHSQRSEGKGIAQIMQNKRTHHHHRLSVRSSRKPSATPSAAAKEAVKNEADAVVRLEPPSTSEHAQVDPDDVTIVKFPETKLFFPYRAEGAEVFLNKQDTVEELSDSLAVYIEELSRDAISKRGSFTVALSGGSLVNLLKPILKHPVKDAIEWENWHVLWADERVVSLESDDSNYKLAWEEFLSKVPIPEEQVYMMDDSLPAEEAAEEYSEMLRDLVEEGIITTTKGAVFPRLDLVLLGIGPDGHVASLFPNSSLLAEKTRWVLPILNSPKPPTARITLSLPVINSSRHVAFVAAGKGKAEAIQRVFERAALPGSLPAQLVQPFNGDITWFVDDNATSQLSASTWNNPKDFPFFDHPKASK